MIAAIEPCPGCGHPLPAAPGQFLLSCRQCGQRFHSSASAYPAVAMQPELNAAGARRAVQKELRRPDVDRAFRTSSFFEKATLYFIPFYEIRGARAGTPTQPGDQPEAGLESAFLGRFPANPADEEIGRFRYNSFTYLERANECPDLDIGFIDLALVEECLLCAGQIPFDPPALRRLGVVLPASRPQPLSSGLEPYSLPLLEYDVRLVFLPVWEIAYSLHGVLFRSYLDAVLGRVIRVHALRSARRNRLRAILWTAAAAIALARTFKLALHPERSPASMMFSSEMLLLFAAVLGANVLLLPYFWQIYAGREMLVFGPGFVEAEPIATIGARLPRWLQRLLEVSGIAAKPPVGR